MASSFVHQIPIIVHLVKSLRPNSVLDIGKGFGKYGFLIHEYAGIDNSKKIDPGKSLKEQSKIKIDAVEVDPDLMMPHLPHLYSEVYFGDVFDVYTTLPRYDLVLMIDIIEHINKDAAIKMLKDLLQEGSKIIVATPIEFFQQELYESKYENHVSHWKLKDFSNIAHVEVQYSDAGAIFLLSRDPINIRGFGNRFIKKLRRIARAVSNEF